MIVEIIVHNSVAVTIYRWNIEYNMLWKFDFFIDSHFKYRVDSLSPKCIHPTV